jgi:3-oxoadipate enol-lactonase
MRVYPDDCDARGHLNQATLLSMLERARWESMAKGPGIDVFSRNDAWPVVRKSTVEYYAEALPGQVLQFDTALTHLGRTSFSLHQTARREEDRTMVAEGDLVFVCVNSDGRPTPVPEEIRRYFGTRPSVRTGTFQHILVGGIATAVDVLGDGPPILLVHGFPLDRTVWRHLAAQLTGWRRIAPDLRGMGLSDAPEGDYSIADYADDMTALLDVLDVERAVVCGLSMGGYVALEMAHRHPERVRALILMATRAEADSEDGKAARDEMIRQLEGESAEVIVDPLLPKLLAPATRSTAPQVVEHLRTMITAGPVSGLIGAVRAMRNREDLSGQLQGIEVPTLVVAGREDRLIPGTQTRALAQAVPGAQYTEIPAAGHLVPLEQPVATGRVVTEFLQLLA